MVLRKNSGELVLAGSSTRDGWPYSLLREGVFVPKSRPHAPVSSYSLAGLLVVIGEEALLAFKGGRAADILRRCVGQTCWVKNCPSSSSLLRVDFNIYKSQLGGTQRKL